VSTDGRRYVAVTDLRRDGSFVRNPETTTAHGTTSSVPVNLRGPVAGDGDYGKKSELQREFSVLCPCCAFAGVLFRDSPSRPAVTGCLNRPSGQKLNQIRTRAGHDRCLLSWVIVVFRIGPAASNCRRGEERANASTSKRRGQRRPHAEPPDVKRAIEAADTGEAFFLFIHTRIGPI